MKPSSTFVAVLICTAAPCASAANPELCQTASRDYATWVVQAQSTMQNNAGLLQELQIEISRGKDYA